MNKILVSFCMYKVLFAQGFLKQPVITVCIGAFWQGFSSEGAMRAASVRSCWKFSPCPIEATPVGSKMDPLSAKAGLSAMVIAPLW